MMKTKNLLLIAIAVLSLFGCKYDDDAIWDAVRNLEERLINLETWQKQASEEIALLKAITDESDYILSVVPVMEGETQKGYTITFKKSGTITLLNGQKGDKGDKGDTPLISLKQEKDGNWYWTLNGSLMTDASGAPIRANGTNGTNGTSAPTPQLKTGRQLKVDSVAGTWQDDAFYLSVDNGKTWNKVSGDKGDKGNTGDPGTGSSSIKITDDSNYDYVIFDVNGDKIKVPRYDVTLSLVVKDEKGLIIPRGEIRSVKFEGTLNVSFSDLSEGSLVISVNRSNNSWSDNTEPNSSHTITAPSKDDCQSDSNKAKCKVIVTVKNKIGETSEYTFFLVASDFLYCNANNLSSMLEKYGDQANYLKVSGRLTSEHMNEIQKLPLVGIDLEDATLEGYAIPDNYFSGKTNLTTVKLPEKCYTIGTGAFSGCTSLEEIELPKYLGTIGNNVFSGCTPLVSISCWNSAPPQAAASNYSLGEGLSNLKKIYVPTKYANQYKDDEFWKQYKDLIEGQAIPQ